MSITNKCESEVNVTLMSSIDDLNADIMFCEDTITIDRQDAKMPHAVLKPSDNRSYICYRKDNKVGVVCKVKPQDANSNVVVCIVVFK